MFVCVFMNVTRCACEQGRAGSGASTGVRAPMDPPAPGGRLKSSTEASGTTWYVCVSQSVAVCVLACPALIAVRDRPVHPHECQPVSECAKRATLLGSSPCATLLRPFPVRPPA